MVRPCITIQMMNEEKFLEDFMRHVFEREGLSHWLFEWVDTYPGECIHDKKVIWIPRGVARNCPDWQQKEYGLHEIAHALLPPHTGCGSPHNAEFYGAYIILLKKYMVGEL